MSFYTIVFYEFLRHQGPLLIHVFSFRYDPLRYNDSIQEEGFWGVCPYPCQGEQAGLPTPMIATDGGAVLLRFLSDNVMEMRGWWIEYQLGL